MGMDLSVTVVRVTVDTVRMMVMAGMVMIVNVVAMMLTVAM